MKCMCEKCVGEKSVGENSGGKKYMVEDGFLPEDGFRRRIPRRRIPPQRRILKTNFAKTNCPPKMNFFPKANSEDEFLSEGELPLKTNRRRTCHQRLFLRTAVDDSWPVGLSTPRNWMAAFSVPASGGLKPIRQWHELHLQVAPRSSLALAHALDATL